MTQQEKIERVLDVIRSAEVLAPFISAAIETHDCPESFERAGNEFLTALQRLYDSTTEQQVNLNSP